MDPKAKQQMAKIISVVAKHFNFEIDNYKIDPAPVN